MRFDFPAVRELFVRVAEPQVLFPFIAVTVLAAIWGTTAHFIQAERENAKRVVEQSTRELVDTYEAQILRNLREIDQTLKVVKYAYAHTPQARVLQELTQKDLLPPALLFEISIIDATGKTVESNRPNAAVADGAAITAFHRTNPELRISQPTLDLRKNRLLDFSRGISGEDGKFAGVVLLSVEVAYFVSGYEKSKLGEHGVLGIVGMDNHMFRVRRSGDAVASGDSFNGKFMNPGDGVKETLIAHTRDAWDGIDRISGIRPLYAFPLMLVVGLSKEEQMLPVSANSADYANRAAIVSAVLLIFLGFLGHTNWKLAMTARRESEAKIAHSERIQHLAYRDGLTGLPNRALFSKLLDQALAHARRHNRSLAILFMDLDRFKQINDTLGHATGDQLLKEISQRLESCLRHSDSVARLGGDEFVILLPDLEEERYAATVAQKILGVVSQPISMQNHNLIGTASIGIAVYPRDGEDEQTLMKHADTAMYHAKEQGKNNFQLYSKSLQVYSLKRLKLESDLRQALAKNELELHYQPKIDMRTEALTGMEALLRWRSPEHGLVSPVEFIPIAEDTGAIVPIGKWVLETACAQNVAWQRAGLPAVCVAVNLSGRQFGDEYLLADIAEVLERTGLDPAYLELEITESMLMNNLEQAIRTLKLISEMGIGLAIDDFGTGYSSLSNLKRFPINTLKIDRAFVRMLPQDVEDGAITVAIISMAKALRLQVVAEGVETAEQAEFLLGHGCDQYQGYYFSKPVPAQQFQEILVKQARATHNAKPLPFKAQYRQDTQVQRDSAGQ